MVFNRFAFLTRGTFVAFIGLTLLAGGCSGSSNMTAPSSADGLVTVFITNGADSPNPLTVKIGQQVNWKNNDTIEHSATLQGVFDTGSIPALSAHDVPVTFSTAGTFQYHCTLHPGETGTIIVQ